MRWLGKLLKILAQVILTLVFLIFFAVIFAEWFVGCGETYIDSKGRRHFHECLFLNHHKK